MHAAQWLFENGLITYPRTDSISIAPEAADEARKMVVLLFGNESLDSGKRWDRVQAHSEGAHEAIRPTAVARLPDQLPREIGEDSRKLYGLIWKRFIAWYMIPAQYRVITVELERDESQSQRA
jgi:DNA topoisomerase-1